MRVALVLLCIGAVTFLLRVLAAFVKEWMSMAGSEPRVHFAKLNPSRQRGELVEMNPEANKRKVAMRTTERMAL
jgi:hypothetical protein